MTMQIFEKLIVELKKHDVSAFKPWLHMVVKNNCMMYFRKENAKGKKSAKLNFELGNLMENEPHDHLIEAEDEKQEAEDRAFVIQYLKDGMEELKEEQRECIELFYIKNCSYIETAKLTGYSVNEVKSYLQNGKRNLKKYITSKSNEEQDGENEVV